MAISESLPSDLERGPGDRILIDALGDFKLSSTVRTLFDQGRQLAQDRGYKGSFGTGLLLMVLYRYGEQRLQMSHKLAPTELTHLLRRNGPEVIDDAIRRYLARTASSKASSEPLERLSPNLRAVLQRAAKLPSHDGILAARHLVVALLATRSQGNTPTGAWRIIDDAKLDRQAILQEFLTGLAQEAPPKERPEWLELSQRLASNPSGDLLEAVKRDDAVPLTVPGYGSDSPSGLASDDCLDLGAFVSAMASLVASVQLDGNLSLGVFGDWGSGKSFFMRRLRNAIDELTAQARIEAARGTTTTFWPNVVQVEFNAWHYVDSNLWASLVAHLLEELRRFDPALSNAKDQTPLELALEKLQIAADARGQAVRKMQAADAAKEKAQSEVAAAKKNVDSLIETLAKKSAESLWSLVEPKVKDQRELLEQQLKELGGAVTDAKQPLQDLYQQAKDLTSTGGRLYAIWTDVLADPKNGGKIIHLAAITLLPLIVLVAFAATPLGESLRNGASVLATTIGTITLSVAQTARWLSRHTEKVMKALKPLAELRRGIEVALDEAEAVKTEEVTRLEKRLRTEQAALEQARAELSSREAELTVAAAQVGEAINGRVIGRFIEERLCSGDYQKHLGLIALIRNDFERLSQLIAGHNCQRLALSQQKDEIRAKLRRARPEIEPEVLDGIFANLGINRIVLYIDDLDRCPSSRVVEVLQAIHLLLAFPVFVVVVGVDARWVAHSLAKEYPELLTHENCANHGPLRLGTSETASPADYLEKIFQIPFWIPPLDSTATRRLLTKLTQNVTVEGPPSQAATSPDEIEALARESVPAATVESPQGGDEVEQPSRSGLQPLATAKPIGAAPLSVTPPKLFSFSEEERKAMAALAPIIGRSPRATNRFVNSYRLLKTALTPEERQQLNVRDDELGSLAVPMFLLAMVTGTPDLVGEFLAVAKQTTGTVFDCLRNMAQPDTLEERPCSSRLRLAEFLKDASLWQNVTFEDALLWRKRVVQFSFEDLDELTRTASAQ